VRHIARTPITTLIGPHPTTTIAMQQRNNKKSITGEYATEAQNLLSPIVR
jgi:hypothetical protein